MLLRPYQNELIDEARQSIIRHKSSLLVMATGLGKTAVTVHMMAEAARRGKSSMFMVHRDTLLNQTSKALWQQHLEHGMIASGRSMSARMPVQVASVQTLVRRLEKIPAPDLIVIDEAHRAAAETYRKILEAYPKSRVIGLTATPQRTDGKGLSDVFDDMVIGPDVSFGIANGYLCGYRIIAPPSQIDLEGVKIRMGDYATDDVERIVDKPTVTGDAVKHYLEYARGKRCVVFCATLKHAQHVRDAYNDAGVPAEYMDGSTTWPEREAILTRIAGGQTLVLVNVELVIEGVDVPAIEVVQWLRPTASLIIWMQGNGRGFRPADNKGKLIILDHVNNWQRHGLPDDQREWSLDGQPKQKRGEKKQDVSVKQCLKCYSIFTPGPTHCPICGESLAGDGRKIEIVEGDLVEIDLDTERKQKYREQGAAKSLTELIELAIRRGQRKPAEWACFVNAAREKRKPTPDEFNIAKEYARHVRT